MKFSFFMSTHWAPAYPLLASALIWLTPWGRIEASELEPQCVLDLAASAEGSMTLDEIRQRCSLDQSEAGPAPAAIDSDDNVHPVADRLDADSAAIARPFTIMAHKPNYFLAAAWNSEGWNPELFQQASGDPDYYNKDVESQFQISLKVPLAINLFDDRVDVYAAYTNRSLWQVYNSEYSAPFRETNHEPEAWAQFRNDWQIGGWTNTVNSIGFVHQSNGRAGVLSRSWNRVYASAVFERNHWAVGIKPWIWVAQHKHSSDNPDIDDYMGHGEVRVAYGRHGHAFSAMLRNQLESGFDRGAVELSWSFPVFSYPYLKGYVQYFYGYGESLIDYNNKVNRIGVGISLTDWLN